MENIVLIGHSRGGEAVANAAAFNKLSYYPDDASLEFRFGYGIKGIISIAPVDGQYLPTGRKVVVEDLSYLTFHGSHDGDVTSFHGLRIYDRLKFNNPDLFNFKSAVYVYRANHGQWNTVWGSHDGGPRSGRSLDLRGLIDAEDHRRFSEIYVSAFLDVVLKGDKRYLPIFRDHRVIGGWLPSTMYITRFETSGFRPLATFEEDIDITVGTEPGVLLRGDSLEIWKEELLALRSSNRNNTSSSQENQAVTIGWNNRISGSDTTRYGPPAKYSLELPAGLSERWQLSKGHTLDFMLGPTKSVPSPRGDPDSASLDEEPDSFNEERVNVGSMADEVVREVDLSIELEDVIGRVSRVTLSDYGAIRRPLETWILRRSDQERERFTDHWELILQTYSIPLGDFKAENQGLDLRRLLTIRFVFDRSHAGEVSIDQIGFSDLDAAFLRARVERNY